MVPKVTCAAYAALADGLLARRTGLWSDGMPRPVTDSDGRPLPGSISEKIYLKINGAQQGMSLQGADVRNPVMLYLHGGMPEFFFTERTWLVHRTSCSAFETAENMRQSGRNDARCTGCDRAASSNGGKRPGIGKAANRRGHAGEDGFPMPVGSGADRDRRQAGPNQTVSGASTPRP